MSATATGSLNLMIDSRESEFIEAVHEVVAAGSQHTAANSGGSKCITNLKLSRVDQVPGDMSKRGNNFGKGGRYERERCYILSSLPRCLWVVHRLSYPHFRYCTASF